VLLAATAAAAQELRLAGEAVQGGLIRGQVPPGTEIRLDGRALRVAADGLFVFGFGRDAKPDHRLTLRLPDGSHQERSLTVAKRSYRVQRIDGLAPRMVTPDAAALVRIRRENGWIAAARQRDTPEPHFAAGFAWPLRGPITGVFGSQRILNGEPRRPHYGVDIAGPRGKPVLSPAAGLVALVEADLYYTGGTIIIDHGHGLTSVLSHLSAVLVKLGEIVEQGQLVGRVGASGRATGPHLDWRVNWFAERLDPARLVPPMPKPEGG